MSQAVSSLKSVYGGRLGLTVVDLMMLATTCVWSFNFSVVKQTLREMQPMVFVGFRFALAATFAILILLLSGENLRFHREDALKLLLLGLIGNTLHQTLFTQGIARTTAGNSSLISNTTPIFVILISLALRLEDISGRQLAGVALSFTGTVIVIVMGGSSLSLSDRTLVGNLLTLCSAFTWSFYTLVARRLMRRYSALKITALSMGIGAPFLLLLSVPEMARQDWSAISTRGWFGLGYAFLFASVLGYFVWNTSVQRCGNARTSVYQNLIPVGAILIGWLMLGERLVLWQGIGAAITLTGIFLTRSAPRKAAECS